jgi:MoxR-like ATPase
MGTNVLEDDPAGGRRFQFRPGPIMANLVLADEVNRATPKTQSALLEAMQERSVTTAGTTRPLPRPFFVMATQNPIEMEGTYPLPEAQLDRFLLKVVVPFPEPADLLAVVQRTTTATTVEVRKIVDGERLRSMIHLTRMVPVATHVVQHAVDLVVASHPQRTEAPDAVRKYVRFGSSPRGAQSLILAAKAAALMDGRPNASIDDVRALAPAVLQHRMVLGYEALADSLSAADVVAAILAAVPAPGSGLRGVS